MVQEQMENAVAEKTAPIAANGSLINAYIGFDGKCREAMNFYQQCIGGELTVLTVGESPMADRCPAGTEDHIMHAMLKKDNMIVMGSDMTPPTGHVVGTNMSLCVNCQTKEEIYSLFEKLSAGGTVVDPVGVKFWGGIFGVLVDKFGVSWMFEYDNGCGAME